MRILALLAMFLSVAGCTSHTSYGGCVGVDDSERDPTLRYHLSIRNVIVGTVLFETLIVPVVVLADQLYCPDGVL